MVDVEGVKDIAIVRETLRIDLRPLEQGRMINIKATYVIDHPLPPKDLPLTFITGVDSVSGVKCTLNGKTLPHTTNQVVHGPKNWMPPSQTPGFVPDEQLLYSRSITDTQHEWILFTVPLQTGRQSIEVTYEVEAGRYYSGKYTALFWQTAYILAPARTWKSFGGLDVEVLAPENWQVKSNLALVNQGQRWTASFDSLPADYLTLTTQHPKGRWVPVLGIVQSLYLTGIVIMLILLGQMWHSRRTKQNLNIPDQSHNKHRYEGLFYLLLYFLPLVWNAVVIILSKSDLPDSQNNYQLFVIFVVFQGIHWFLLLTFLMLVSKVVSGVFCDFGPWLWHCFFRKQNAEKCSTRD